MKRLQLQILLLVLLIAGSCQLQAQVGINTTNPDTNAALHIFHSSKGVLLPTVNSSDRQTLGVKNAKNGMLVFDEAQKVYYFRDSDSSKWIALNPWRVAENSTDAWSDVRLDAAYNDKNVYIGSSLTQKAQAKLHVEGTGYFKDGLIFGAGSFSIKQGLISCETYKMNGIPAVCIIPTPKPATIFESDNILLKSSSGRIDFEAPLVEAQKDIYAQNDIEAKGKFIGYGTIPLGGIIMWSGTTPPDGWALCNGQISNGYNTPDLKGRFIVGYDPGKTDYDQPGDRSTKGSVAGKMGGEEKHTLTVAEMPSHTHNSSQISSNMRGSGNQEFDSPRNNNINPTSATGGDQPHENRPPYYALAFIMRVK